MNKVQGLTLQNCPFLFQNPVVVAGGFKGEVLVAEEVGKKTKADSPDVGKKEPVDKGQGNFEAAQIGAHAGDFFYQTLKVVL
jgi:hypothetical protein